VHEHERMKGGRKWSVARVNSALDKGSALIASRALELAKRACRPRVQPLVTSQPAFLTRLAAVQNKEQNNRDAVVFSYFVFFPVVRHSLSSSLSCYDRCCHCRQVPSANIDTMCLNERWIERELEVGSTVTPSHGFIPIYYLITDSAGCTSAFGTRMNER